MTKEHDSHFEMRGPTGGYRVAKKDLSPEMMARIRGMACGGMAKGYADGGAVDQLPPRKGPEVGTLLDEYGNPIPVPYEKFRAIADAPMPQDIAEAPTANQSMTAAMTVPGGLPRAVEGADAMRAGFKPIDRALTGAVQEWSDHDKNIDQQRMKESDDRKRLGLVAPGEAPPPPAGAAPAPAAAPTAQRVGFRPYKADMSATEAAAAEQKAAIGANADVAAEMGRQQVRVLDAQHQEMERIEGERRARTEKAMQETQAAMAKHQAAVDEMRNINTTVDPGRYWASRDTGQRILGIAGLVLGALGAGKDGINRAAGMLQQAIDRDVEAQKVELSARLQKGRAAVEGAQSMYAQAREHFQDEGAAAAAAKASAYEMAKNQFEQLTASAAAPAAKAQAQMAIAGIDAKVADLKNEASEKEAKSRIEAGLAGANATHLYAEAGAAAAKGAGGMGGLSKEEQSKMYEVETSTRNIKDNLAKAKDIIRRKGTFELTGTEQTELQRALGDIAQDSARLKDPGSTVREGELANAKRAIGVEGGELTTRNSTALKLLESYEKSIEQRRLEAMRVRGLAR